MARQREWNYDTIRELALMLTVDETGLDATQEGFDPEKIEQWGFDPQRDDLRYLGSYWAPGSLVGADGTTVTIPDAWKAAWKWFYNGIWTDHFLVDRAQVRRASPSLPVASRSSRDAWQCR